MEKENLKELVAHGTVMFPLAFYEWPETWKGRVPLHWHDEIEMIYFKKGSFKYSLNTEEYLIEDPALAFVGSGQLHGIEPIKMQYESAIVFNTEMLSYRHYDEVQSEMIMPLISGELVLPVLIKPEEKIFKKLISIYEQLLKVLKGKGRMKHAFAKAYLLEILALLYENGYLKKKKISPAVESEKIETIKTLLAYLNTHYGEKVTIGSMAELLNLNEQYFCRFFKKHFGKTFTEYLNEVRVEQAAKLLKSTDYKIIDIAAECGFENAGYFIKRFKKIKGVTPINYRKMT